MINDYTFAVHHMDENGDVFYVVPANWVQWITDVGNRFVELNPAPVTVSEQLQQWADNNRDNAGEKFPDLSRTPSGVWVDTDGDAVVFTPYGYRKETEVHNELHG